MEDFKKTVDIEKILKEKNPAAYRWIPTFIINWLKRKIHEDRINECVWINRNKFGYDFNDACLEYVGAKVTWEGLENIPDTGGVIVASNHPLGGIDGLAVIHAISQKRKDVRAIVNDILNNLVNFDGVLMGVSLVGTTSVDKLKTVDAFYGSTGVSFIFPAGLVSRKQEGEIKDLEWKKSFITKAIQHNQPVIPLFVDGKNSKFFYNFAYWRKKLGIKANLEMLFLPDEMFAQTNKNIHLKFGKPIMPTMFDKSKTHLQWAQTVKQMVYDMGKG